ncbi:MAG: BatD family protein [Parachlamydiales bacterium]|jgi:hypothetical protein
MVRLFLRVLLVAILSLLPAGLQAVLVKVELDKNTLKAGQEIQGTLNIQHQPSEKINSSAIKIGDTPLKVTQVSEETNGGIQTTRYIFNLPAKEHGLQLLPSISIPVGGIAYETVSQSYLVNGNSAPATATTTYGKAAADSVWLKLETFIDGKSTLFPGQRTVIGYRYIFNGNIQLSEEVLPLLEAEGFKKVGDPIIKDYKEKKYAVRQIFQEIEAISPGDYQFAESSVSGFIYQFDAAGNPLPQEKILATAPPMIIKVLAFPGNPPTSFNGAIGNYTFAVRLLNLPELSVGDKVTLSLEITGKGNLDDVPMPEVCCQPGFSGKFQQSDIPPVGIVKGSSKAFVVDLRPLSDKITEIPPVEFSFYNPDTQKYSTLRSIPIPITVHPADSPFNQALQDAEADSLSPTPADTAPAANSSSTPASGIEISGNSALYHSDLSDRAFGSWWVLFIIPIGAFFLWMLNHLKKMDKEIQQAKTENSSQDWLELAYKNQEDPSKLYHSIERALIGILKEKGIIPNENITPHDLPREGVSGDVQAFLNSIEEKRFTGHKSLSSKEILTETTKLYDDIKLHITS